MQSILRAKIGTNFLVTIAVVFLGMINSVLLARWLGPTGRGEVTAALLWPSLLPYLGATGLIDASVFFAAQSRESTARIFGNCVAFSLVVSLILVSAGGILMPWLLGNQSEDVVSASRLMLIGIPVLLITEFMAALLRARMMLGVYNLQRLLVPTGYVLVTIGLYLTNSLDVYNIVVSQLVLYGIRAVLCAALCHGMGIQLGMALDWGLAKEMLRFGGKSHVGAIAEQVNTRFDQALIAAWLSPAQLGLYVAAVSATSLIKTLSQALKITILPQIAQESDPTEQDRMLIRGFRTYWTVSIIVAPVFALALYWLIPLVYGDDFSDAILPGVILVFGAVIFGAKDVLSVSAKAVGMPWIGSKAELVAVAITLMLLFLTLPTLGIVGAAITSIAAYVVALIVVAKGLERVRGISMTSLLSLGMAATRLKGSFQGR